MLDGIGITIHESNPIVGLRGLRRGLAHREELELEIRILTPIAQDHRNLNLLFPFVSDADEFARGIEALERCNWPNHVGSMLETPVAVLDAERFVEYGATNLLVGINDLSCLALGADRSSSDKFNASLWSLIDRLHALPVDWGLAGSLTAPLYDLAMRHRVPYVSVHYSELPDVLGFDSAGLPDLGLVGEVKARTREAMLTHGSTRSMTP